MRYHSKPIKKHAEAIMKYLRCRGFHAASTRTGFCAVNKTGMVITVSPLRTLIEYRKNDGRIYGERFDSPKEIFWFEKTINDIESGIVPTLETAQETNG